MAFDYREPDCRVWASEFCRIAKEKGFNPDNPDDQHWVATWIANAMMHGRDRALGTWPVVLPDGSAVAIGMIGDK